MRGIDGRDGFMLDYHIVLAADACASYSQTAHDMTLENIEGYFGKVSEVAQLIDIWMDKNRGAGAAEIGGAAGHRLA